MTPDRILYGFAAEPVWSPVVPQDGESLPSWCARTTIENELPHPFSILREAGQRHRNRVAETLHLRTDSEALAVILDAELSELDARAAHASGDGMVRYLGSEYRSTDLQTRTRRFAPATLAQDAEPFYRASWLVRTFPACPSSWQLLRFRCDCGARQTWEGATTLVICASCGIDLRELSAKFVPDDVRIGLQPLADMLFGNADSRAQAMSRLPEPLRGLDPGHVFELALLLARVVDPGLGNPRENVWRDQPLRLARALACAASLLPAWPETPWLALGDAAAIRTVQARDPALVELGRALRLEYTPDAPEPLAALLDAVVADVTADGALHPRLADIDEAAAGLGTNKAGVRRARARGDLSTHFVMRRSELLPAVEREQVVRIAAGRGWPTAGHVGRWLSLPPYAVEQLCATGDLTWARGTASTLSDDLRIKPASWKGLLGRLLAETRGPEHLDDPVTLATVLRGVGGREKPWASAIRKLLSGSVGYALAGRRQSFRDVMVRRADAETLRGLAADADASPDFVFGEHLTQTDACDVLGLPLKYRALITGERVGEDGHAWLFDRGRVKDLANEVVTAAELAARHFLKGMAGTSVVAKARPRPLRFGFERAHAIAAVDVRVGRATADTISARPPVHHATRPDATQAATSATS